MRLPVLLGVALGDAYVEIGLDFVDEPDILAREFAAGARQRTQVGADELGTALFQPQCPRSVRQQSVGLACQVRGLR